ncbi:MAG: hypothetical protein NVSMB57_07590 [Actinomycetota bacterium]
MNLRKLFATGILGAVALLPSAGRAVTDTNRPVPGTDCNVGSEKLTYVKSNGYWSGLAEVKCESTHPELTVNFVVRQVQGFNTYPTLGLGGPVRMTSSTDGTSANSLFRCLSCAGLKATGGALTLDPGLYVMTTDAVVTSVTPLTKANNYRRGDHSTCFLITSADTDTPQSQAGQVPGCTL